jgi:hypothetical protein
MTDALSGVRVWNSWRWRRTGSSFPLLAVVYRAPLGKVDFSLFGAGMDAIALLAHFGSTANALKELHSQSRMHCW